MYIHNYTGYQTSINTPQLVQGNVHISSSTKCISETDITADIAPVTKQTHLQQLILFFVIHVLPGLVKPCAPSNFTAVKTCSHTRARAAARKKSWTEQYNKLNVSTLRTHRTALSAEGWRESAPRTRARDEPLFVTAEHTDHRRWMRGQETTFRQYYAYKIESFAACTCIEHGNNHYISCVYKTIINVLCLYYFRFSTVDSCGRSLVSKPVLLLTAVRILCRSLVSKPV